MRLTRHAKNRLRLLGISLAEVESLVTASHLTGCDAEGRMRFAGLVRGIGIRIVVAVDEPDLIVTIHPRRRV